MISRVRSILILTLLPFVCGILSTKGSVIGEMQFTEAILKVFCGYATPRSESVIELLRSLSPILIFAILFGNYVYNDMTNSGMYIMVRYKKRAVFCLKKSIGMVLFSAVYSVFFTLGVLVILSPESLSGQDRTILLTAFYDFAFMCMITVLTVNILSLFLGSSNGFAGGLSIFALMCVDCVTNRISKFKGFSAAKLNLIRNYIINWHDSPFAENYPIWERYKIKGFYFDYSMVLFAATAVILLIVLFIAVQLHEIAVGLKEEV